MTKISVKIEVFVTVDDSGEAKEIGNDLHKILGKSGYTNKVVVTDEISF
jgi:hypothetical protein